MGLYYPALEKCQSKSLQKKKSKIFCFRSKDHALIDLHPLQLRRRLILRRSPVMAKLLRDNFNWGIKHWRNIQNWTLLRLEKRRYPPFYWSDECLKGMFWIGRASHLLKWMVTWKQQAASLALNNFSSEGK